MDGETIRKAAGLCGGLGVCVGAFGAHALNDILKSRGTLASFQTGVQYHLLHSVALLALSAASKGTEHSLTAKLWVAGTVLFSGSIYGLSLGGPRILGPVTPLGGLCLIAGWFALAL